MSLQPTKTGIHPSGKVIEFYELEHQYQIQGEPEIEFTSATTWISQFFPEFERDKVSWNYAQKHNMHQRDVLAMWDKQSNTARERGTLIHEKAEQSILHFLKKGTHVSIDDIMTPKDDDGLSDDPERTCSLIKSMHSAVVKMGEVLGFLQTEYVIASPELHLSGMVDITVKLRSEKDRPLIGLYDWKTNKQIEKHNRWQNGLTPISHLSHCNFIHYSLQLNLYEYICRREGYFSPDTDYQKVLIHLSPDGFKTYKCENMQGIIEMMLESDPSRIL